MQWTNSFLARLLLCGGIAAQLAGATTIIESTGNSGGAVTLGYYVPYGSAEVAAVGWTQTSSYANVDVTASLPYVYGNVDLFHFAFSGTGHLLSGSGQSTAEFGLAL